MKHIPIFSLAIVIGLMASTGRGYSEPAMRDAATHEQLSGALRKAQQQDPMRKLELVVAADPAKADPPKGLLSQSDMICFNGHATLVPKRALIHIPARLADRVKMVPGNHLQTWEQFYADNRGWISTVEVSRQQAEGNASLPEPVLTAIAKSSNLVVATLLGGPISILPPKEVVENPTEKPQP